MSNCFLSHRPTNLSLLLFLYTDCNLCCNIMNVVALCISQFQLHPPLPPRQLRGICPHSQSQGPGISLPQGYPRLLTHTWFLIRNINVDFIWSIEKDRSLSLIDFYVKGWTKLRWFLKVCFLSFIRFLIAYRATT